MSISNLIKAIRRGGTEEVSITGSRSGNVYVRKAVPDLATLVLEGKVWKAQDLTTTAVLNDVLPTTVSALTLQNPAGSEKYYLVLAVTAISDTAGPVSLGSVSFSHCAHRLAVAPYTRDVAVTSVVGLKCGQGSYGGGAILDRQASVVDDLFSPIGSMIVNAIASQTWMSGYIPLEIPPIIPPSYHYSVGTTGNDATFEIGMGLVWAELDLTDLD